MVIGTYNGASILAFPTSPAPKQIELAMNDTNAMSRSPFTGSTRVQAWPGADWWDASIALPQLQAANAAVWSSFLAECRGMLNTFLLSDPAYSGPQGTVKGAPVVSGVNNAMATTLNTRGWTPSSFRLLLPGDYLQLGSIASGVPCRLFRVLDQVNSDANGNATITIWPSLREATTDGEAITFNKPAGLFRLAENRRSVLTDITKLSGISLKAIEAR
jgi:hypothetical protein